MSEPFFFLIFIVDPVSRRFYLRLQASPCRGSVLFLRSGCPCGVLFASVIPFRDPTRTTLAPFSTCEVFLESDYPPPVLPFLVFLRLAVSFLVFSPDSPIYPLAVNGLKEEIVGRWLSSFGRPPGLVFNSNIVNEIYLSLLLFPFFFFEFYIELLPMTRKCRG